MGPGNSIVFPRSHLEAYIEERESDDRKSGRKFTLMQILPTISIGSSLLLLVLLTQLLKFNHLPSPPV